MPERACAGQVRGVDSLRKEYRNVLDLTRKRGNQQEGLRVLTVPPVKDIN
jgi:hypothetical protein